MPDRTTGLTSAQAAQRLAEYGPNEPVLVRRLSALVQLLHLVANPLVLILLVASAISTSPGEHTDAAIIVTIVLIGIAINFWQTYRSQQAADRLRASVAPTATVGRDGQRQEIPLRAVVPGDLIRLSAGDRVPADGRFVEAISRCCRRCYVAIDHDARCDAGRDGQRESGARRSMPSCARSWDMRRRSSKRS